MSELPARIRELGMDACAITDHGVMYGVLDFYRSMKKAGVKPIIGCEVYVAPRTRHDKDSSADREPYHLILLAETNQGYHNLVKLVSLGFTEGFYYRPRVDREALEDYHEGLIALSACLSGEVPRKILRGEPEGAREAALFYKQVFGPDHYYLELQSNNIPEQNEVNAHLIRLSGELDIPMVVTNDCHYLKREDAFAHEVLLCMQTGKRMSDEDRMRMESDTFYVRSPEEMAALFPDLPEAIANTERIAERCQVELEFGHLSLPHFDTGSNETGAEMLWRLCHEGLEHRMATRPTDISREDYETRLKYEFDVISSMGYVDYYLIVWDFIRYARENGIMVGPGRGSGAASLIAYTLKITDIDPLKYDLLFERFLNVERVSMPDFDIDFCFERRGEVIDYVTKKYGEDHVCQVITFGTLAARAVIRDVARALDVSYQESDRIAKMVPNVLKITLDQALEMSSELRQAYEQDDTARKVIDLARRFEGMPRHASTHAAGVVIAGKPISEIAPLAKNDESVVVQFTKDDIESVGLLKFDLLGLRTLTVLQETADLVKKNTGEVIDFDRMTFDDPNIYRMIGEGDTAGVFQLESGGMTQFMKELKPESFEDIIAGISLFRPGPMVAIPRYVAGRHDASKITYDHPMLQPILDVTYGCTVYQEQVMRIVRDLAGFSLGQADNVRRAMSKKKPEQLARYRSLFLDGGKDETGRTVDGAVKRGVPRETAEKIFEDVMAFAGYAFNKAHAAAYAAVAYYTAYCKYYYPVEFLAAMLNSYLGNLDKAGRYVRVAEAMGISVLPPDVNRSGERFATEGKAIRFALGAVKNVGLEAIRELVTERDENGPFTSYGDFLSRISETNVNRKVIESLVRSSACDGFDISRSKMLAVIDPFLDQLQHARRHTMIGQISLFEMTEDESLKQSEPNYPTVPPFSMPERLAMEKEMLGLYVTGHPLSDYRDALAALKPVTADMLLADGDGPEQHFADRTTVHMSGLIVGKRELLTKHNDRMAFITLEDETGSYEMIVFPGAFERYGEFLTDNRVLLIEGTVSKREDEETKIIAEKIAVLEHDMRDWPPDFNHDRSQSSTDTVSFLASDEERTPHMPHEAERSGETKLIFRLPTHWTAETRTALLAACRYFSGAHPVRIFDEREGCWLNPGYELSISWTSDTLALLTARFGQENIGIL